MRSRSVVVPAILGLLLLGVGPSCSLLPTDGANRGISATPVETPPIPADSQLVSEIFPEGIPPEDELGYWTEERMRNAQPAPMPSTSMSTMALVLFLAAITSVAVGILITRRIARASA